MQETRRDVRESVQSRQSAFTVGLAIAAFKIAGASLPPSFLHFIPPQLLATTATLRVVAVAVL